MESVLTINEQKTGIKFLNKNICQKKYINTMKIMPKEEGESPNKLCKTEEKKPKKKSEVFVLSKNQRRKQRRAQARDLLSGSLPKDEDVVHPSGPWPGLVVIEYLHGNKRPKTMLKISLRKCASFGLFSKFYYQKTSHVTPSGKETLYKAIYHINGVKVGRAIGPDLCSAQDNAASNAMKNLKEQCYTIRVKTEVGVKTEGIKTITRAALGDDEEEMFVKAEEIITTHFAKKSVLDDLLFSSEFDLEERKKLYKIAAKYKLQSETQGPKDNCQVVMFQQMSSWKILQELLKGQVSSKYELIPPKIMSQII